MHSFAVNGQSNVLFENISALRTSIDKARRAWVCIAVSLDRRIGIVRRRGPVMVPSISGFGGYNVPVKRALFPKGNGYQV